MKTWRGEQHPEKVYYPVVPGYENAGEVVHLGPDAKGDFAIGDRVMINECREFANACAAWGGSSEYVIKDSVTASSPFDLPAKIPEAVSYEDAVLAYLASVALKGVGRIPLDPAHKVVVVGAGMIGISAMQILKIICPGITVICLERHPARRQIVEQYVDYVQAPDGSEIDAIADLTEGRMADTVIECSGNAAVVGSLHRLVKEAGWGDDDPPAHIHLQGDYPERIVFDSYHRWFVKNCTITMSCALKRGCKERILQWMDEGKFDTKGLPVEIWPVEKCAGAFEHKQKKGEEVFKVLLDWGDGA